MNESITVGKTVRPFYSGVKGIVRAVANNAFKGQDRYLVHFPQGTKRWFDGSALVVC